MKVGVCKFSEEINVLFSAEKKCLGRRDRDCYGSKRGNADVKEVIFRSELVDVFYFEKRRTLFLLIAFILMKYLFFPSNFKRCRSTLYENRCHSRRQKLGQRHIFQNSWFPLSSWNKSSSGVPMHPVCMHLHRLTVNALIFVLNFSSTSLHLRNCSVTCFWKSFAFNVIGSREGQVNPRHSISNYLKSLEYTFYLWAAHLRPV